ncbi:nuclear transport factor 2 family protein [Ralstonia pseudosolanacearum]|uniref:nuclear transport factor 2 family protein n=1 Tax=Ralstonia pseudosolanacearum TaxID=1310165 RepID=UPI001FF79457|nr:nuclear transport factor 2 family protein [Ralstonia pseudosolanacearum]
MTSTIARQTLLDRLDAFCDTWAGVASMPEADLLADAVEYFSSHRGNAQGREPVLNLLREDFAGLNVRIAAANRVPRARHDACLVGAYVHGEARRGTDAAQSPPAAFGGVIVLTFESGRERPRIRSIRFQLNWLQGNASLLPRWQVPPMDRLWQPGDAPAVVVSELDAPWHRIPDSELAASDAQAIAEAWFRYAWTLDQADYALFERSFSEDVEAELTPMGRMQGRRALMATLKAFRMPWPWMQHYGEPIRIDIEDSGRRAMMMLGRIMPGQTATPDGKRLYGAYYRIEAVRGDAAAWRISRMEYVPGWIRT